jgi:SAM-dependent methyltransferase
MRIDEERMAEIVEKYRYVDPHAAYNMKDACKFRSTGALVPETGDVLSRAFREVDDVLDVGCGRGHTLLEHAHLFKRGVGIDESAEHMIGHAIRARDELGVRNVEFRVGKAASLPFADGEFDLVYSERGPLGHNDRTLEEALRVLGPRGLVFIETLGDFDSLGREKGRVERFGVAIQTLAVRIRTLVFGDAYEYAAYICAMAAYDERELPSLEALCDPPFLPDQLDAHERVSVPMSTIWIAGSKASC